MQVNGSYFEVAMTEQYLNRAQVGAGFKKMRGETVSKSVRMNVPMHKASAFSGVLAGSPEDLSGNRITCSMPSVAGKQPLCRLASEPAPVRTQRFEKLRAQHDVAVQASLASPDMNHHALTVNIADLKMSCFSTTCAGA